MQQHVVIEDKKRILSVYGEIEKDIKNIFVFRITNVKLFHKILTVAGQIEVEENCEKIDQNTIIEEVKKFFNKKRPHQKIIIPPQKTGKYTGCLRVVVKKDGYCLEHLWNENWTMCCFFCRELVAENSNTRKMLAGYRKNGARFIYTDDTLPSQDLF